ncbi:MAG TPA: nuclear transport factor 2 family protein [Rubricoccaceae bacterium]|nr:nuclear transport factor 2 family protein [Rubricoccaceae bacterium]
MTARFLPLLAFLLAALPASAQVPDPAAVIPRLLTGSADAWNAADLDGHVAIYADSARFMTGNGPVTGRDHTRALLAQHFWRDGQPIQQLRFEQIAVTPLGSEHALVTGRFVLTGGGEDEASGWFSTVWAWNGTRWETIHDHSS